MPEQVESCGCAASGGHPAMGGGRRRSSSGPRLSRGRATEEYTSAAGYPAGPVPAGVPPPAPARGACAPGRRTETRLQTTSPIEVQHSLPVRSPRHELGGRHAQKPPDRPAVPRADVSGGFSPQGVETAAQRDFRECSLLLQQRDDGAVHSIPAEEIVEGVPHPGPQPPVQNVLPQNGGRRRTGEIQRRVVVFGLDESPDPGQSVMPGESGLQPVERHTEEQSFQLAKC